MTETQSQRIHAIVYSNDSREELGERIVMLEDENERLRELVGELWVSCPVHDGDCDECKHKGRRTGCELYDRMRELGVEVCA